MIARRSSDSMPVRSDLCRECQRNPREAGQTHCGYCMQQIREYNRSRRGRAAQTAMSCGDDAIPRAKRDTFGGQFPPQTDRARRVRAQRSIMARLAREQRAAIRDES